MRPGGKGKRGGKGRRRRGAVEIPGLATTDITQSPVKLLRPNRAVIEDRKSVV